MYNGNKNFEICKCFKGKKRKRFKCFFDIYIINEIKGVLV